MDTQVLEAALAIAVEMAEQRKQKLVEYGKTLQAARSELNDIEKVVDKFCHPSWHTLSNDPKLTLAQAIEIASQVGASQENKMRDGANGTERVGPKLVQQAAGWMMVATAMNRIFPKWRKLGGYPVDVMIRTIEQVFNRRAVLEAENVRLLDQIETTKKHKCERRQKIKTMKKHVQAGPSYTRSGTRKG